MQWLVLNFRNCHDENHFMKIKIKLTPEQTRNMAAHIDSLWAKQLSDNPGSTREGLMRSGRIARYTAHPITAENVCGRTRSALDPETGIFSFEGNRSDFRQGGHHRLLVAAVEGDAYLSPIGGDLSSADAVFEHSKRVRLQEKSALTLLRSQVVEHVSSHDHLPFDHTIDDQVASHDLSTDEGFAACMEALANMPYEQRLERFKYPGADWGASYAAVIEAVNERAGIKVDGEEFEIVRLTIEQAAQDSKDWSLDAGQGAKDAAVQPRIMYGPSL